MKTFKNAVALMAAVSMCVSMNAGMTTYAETLNELGTSSSDVTATYVSSEIETIYSVDITWGSMEFTYTESGAQTWDPSTHTYSEEAEGGWDYNSGNKVKVSNHSNAAITVECQCDIDESYTDIVIYGLYGAATGNIGNFESSGAETQTATRKIILNSAASVAYGNPDNPPYVEFTLFLEGSPGDIADNTVIGTITVTLTAYE